MGNISLTSSMRSNLQPLQEIARNQNVMQNRLATGLKVSSAIDNPSSFYTAQSLNNRSADLGALLDSMSQGIQTIKAATQAIDIAGKMLEQAKAVARRAMENTQKVVARVSTEADLQAAIASGKSGLIVIDQDIVMSTNNNIVLKDEQSLVGAKYLDKTARQTSISFNFVDEAKSGIEANNSSIISDLNLNVIAQQRGSKAVIEATAKNNITLNNINITMNTSTSETYGSDTFMGISGDNIEITGNINIKDVGPISNTNNGGNYVTGGLSGAIKITGNAIVNINTNGFDGRAVSKGNISLLDKAQLNINTNSNSGHALMASTINVKDNSQLNINAGGYIASATTINVDNNGSFNAKGKSLGLVYSKVNILSKNTSTNIKANATLFFSNPALNLYSGISMVTGSKISIPSGVFTAKNNMDYNINSGNNIFNGYLGNMNTEFETSVGTSSPFPIAFDNMFADFNQHIEDNIKNNKEDNNKNIAKESYQYNTILNQFDNIIKDGGYKGINLLLEQNLKINFNEDRSSGIEIKGVDASTKGLGLETKDWLSNVDIEKSIAELDSAISELRGFSAEFGNSFSIVSTREKFTESIINFLTEGADKLTLADMNQESANMLALQTRQQLAVNSLSLASQAAQSVLKLF